MGLLLVLLPVLIFAVMAADVGGVVAYKLGMLRAAHAAVEEMKFSGQYDQAAQTALQGTLSGAGVNGASVSAQAGGKGAPVWVNITPQNYQLPVPFQGLTTPPPPQGSSSGTAFSQ